jgi:hypothetical protein
MTLTVKVEREDIEDEDLDEEEKANKPIPTPYAHSPRYNAPKVSLNCWGNTFFSEANTHTHVRHTHTLLKRN